MIFFELKTKTDKLSLRTGQRGNFAFKIKLLEKVLQ